MLRVAAVGAAAAVLVFLPSTAWAQVAGGGAGIGLGGIGGQGGQLGPPPAGVLLHQQYMQLYGLPTSFLQGQTNNGGGQGILAGGYGGYGYGGPRFFGVNYQRNLMAARAYMAQAALYQASPYGLNAQYQYPTVPQASASYGSASSFGIANANPFLTSGSFPTTFGGQTSTDSKFRGFGLSTYHTFNGQLAPLSNKDEDKKEQEAKGAK